MYVDFAAGLIFCEVWKKETMKARENDESHETPNDQNTVSGGGRNKMQTTQLRKCNPQTKLNEKLLKKIECTDNS